MIDIKNEGIILEKTELDFENRAVLNPACVEKDGIVHMFYRAVNSANVSTIGYCQLKNNKVIFRADRPLIFPEFDFEKQGVEDPRIIFMDGCYYLFYTGYDGKDARTALAVSSDLKNFKKLGLVAPNIKYREAKALFDQSGMPQKYDSYEQFYEKEHGQEVLLWEKDFTLFSEKINGKFAILHRVLPGIQIAYFDDFSQLMTSDYWKKYLLQIKDFMVLNPKYWFENRKIGAGCPLIKTSKGWLLIFHAVENALEGKIYRASAALLDLKNPQKIIGRLTEPLFAPTEPWEINGDTHNVVFPTGHVLEDDKLTIYYGAADSRIGAKSLSLKKLLDLILKSGS